MTNIALLFVGCVLLINGLSFCGVLNPRAGIPINILVGAALLVATALTFHEISGALDPSENRVLLFSAAGFTLFGFTYLGVAGQGLLQTDGRSLGTYCGWATVIALVSSAVNVQIAPDMAWLWFAWAVLYLSFAIALFADTPQWSFPAGALAIWLAISSTTVPGLLMIDGSWDDIPVLYIAAAQIAGLVIYAVAWLKIRSVPSPRGTTEIDRERVTG